MSTANEVRDLIRSSFHLERNHGLDFEVSRMLPPGWTVEHRSDGYAFAGPWSTDWEATVWKLARFLAYKSFLSLHRSGVAGSMAYELVSAREDGTGFRATFDVDALASNF